MTAETVWVAFSRVDAWDFDGPPAEGPGMAFRGVYKTREEALKHCWPVGDPRFIEEYTL